LGCLCMFMLCWNMKRSYGGAATHFPGIAVLCRIIPGCSLLCRFVPGFVVKSIMRIF
jgi:hypothetical protein